MPVIRIDLTSGMDERAIFGYVELYFKRPVEDFLEQDCLQEFDAAVTALRTRLEEGLARQVPTGSRKTAS